MHLDTQWYKIQNTKTYLNTISRALTMLPYDAKFWREKTLAKWLTAIIGG